MNGLPGGDRLRALRKARHRTLRTVAEAAGISEGYLSQIERGQANPSIATLQQIASALGLKVADLFGDDFASGPGSCAPTRHPGSLSGCSAAGSSGSPLDRSLLARSRAGMGTEADGAEPKREQEHAPKQEQATSGGAACEAARRRGRGRGSRAPSRRRRAGDQPLRPLPRALPQLSESFLWLG